MSVPSITLKGEAVRGIHRDGVAYAQAVAALPKTVKLGRLPMRPEQKRKMVHLADFLNPTANPPPVSTNWRAKAAMVIARMYLNDQLGDCVIASNIHLLGVTSANDPDSGGAILAQDSEVSRMYQQICGPGDNGCNIADTLDWGIKTGWVAGGKTYKIDGYAAVDWTNQALVKACLLIGGCAKIGFDLPSAWESSSTWDVTSSPIIGGHDVLPIDYDAQGVYVLSWGRVYLMTWPAFLSTRWISEMYYVATPTWYGADRLAPSGFDKAKLDKAFAEFKGGLVPDWEPNGGSPPPPPSPPAPHEPLAITLHGSFPSGGIFGGTKDVVITGTATPMAGWPTAILDEYGPAAFTGFNSNLNLMGGFNGNVMGAGSPNWFAVFQDVFAIYGAVQAQDWNAVAAAVQKLLADLGITHPTAHEAVGKLSPEQWQAIIQAILQLITIFTKK